jgi:hypothetical protein
MDLICDPALVVSSHSMRLKSNGGTMEVKKQAISPGYHAHVWYKKKAITNILSLSNVIKQYRVMYDSNDQMFVVHCELEGKPDMEFRMHKSGLHYLDPRGSKFIFVNTVSKNKAGFTKRQIKEVEVTQSLSSKLNYPSWKDFKWIIQSNQIKDCPVTVDHVDTALKIWGKNVAALKGKTTRTKPDPVARDFVKVPVELLKLHKEVYITANLFFQQDSVFPNVESQDMFYGNQSPRGQNCSANIQGVQGDLPVLSPTWLSHYNGTCRQGICTPQGSD